MTVLRAPGEVYLQYNNHIADVQKYGQVELIDPESLETIHRSPRLSTGGHTWCTGLVAHANGYLYLTNGNRCFKLDPECNVAAEKILPQDAPYNSLLVTSDGRLIMKNIERDTDRVTKFVVLDPDTLEQVGPETALPENSMGRIAMDSTSDGQLVYVPGSHHFYRYRYVPARGTLELDTTWQPLYRTLPDEEQSFSWDSCLCDDGCWFLDNGDNEANEVIFRTRPVGQDVPPRGSVFRGLAASPQKLIRVDVNDATQVDVCAPFGVPRGSIFSPPAYDPLRGIAIAFDTGNGRIGGVRYNESSPRLSPVWEKDCRISMQLVLYPDTGEVAVNDFRTGSDNVVILDVDTGREKGRVATESRTANGMFLAPGWNRDVMYCSIGSLARIWVDD